MEPLAVGVTEELLCPTVERSSRRQTSFSGSTFKRLTLMPVLGMARVSRLRKRESLKIVLTALDVNSLAQYYLGAWRQERKR
jgi:hypothetical protein